MAINTVWSLFGIKEGLCKRIVLNLQRSNLLILISCDCYELRLGKRKRHHPPLLRADAHQVHPGLVLVQGVEHYLAVAVALVRQLDLGEGDGLLHPVGAEVGRLRVDVDGVGGWHLGLSAGDPLAVDVLPPVLVNLDEFKEDGVHGFRVQAGGCDFYYRKHSPGKEKIVCLEKPCKI